MLKLQDVTRKMGKEAVLGRLIYTLHRGRLRRSLATTVQGRQHYFKRLAGIILVLDR